MIPIYSDPHKPIPQGIQRRVSRIAAGFPVAVVVLSLFFCWLAF